MIRKTVIVVLTLAAAAFGTLGTVVGSGCFGWTGQIWHSGTWGNADCKDTVVSWGNERRLILIQHVEFLDGPAPPWKKRWRGTGWLFQTTVVSEPLGTPIVSEPPGLASRSWTIVVSFVIPLIVAVVLAIYPTIAFIRGPLRRWRRRRAGLCLKCGYDLTGNESGVCPECGTEVEQS